MSTTTLNRVPDVVNNLTSDSTTSALSAAQGKALKTALGNTDISAIGSSITEAISSLNSNKLNVDAFVRPNLLDNWYFVGGGSQQGGGQFPINQRGQTSYSTNQYGLDRWKCYNAGISIASEHIYSESATDASAPVMTQIIENPSRLYGKTLTASVLFTDGTLGTGTKTYSDSTTTIFWDNKTGSALYLSASGYFQFYHANSYGVIAAKLEIGDTQTLVHQENGVWVLNEIPNYGEELRKCQRYYVDLGDVSVIIPTKIGSDRIVTSRIPFPVQMRSTGTATFNYINAVYDFTHCNTDIVASISPFGINFDITNSTLITLNRAMIVNGLKVSADL